MDSISIHSIEEQLREVKAEIEAKVTTLRSELHSLDDEQLRVNSALAALHGKQLSNPPSNPEPCKPRRKIANPTAGKSDVISFMKSVLLDLGTVEEEALKEAVEAKATAAGFNRIRLSLRFKEALSDSQFDVTSSGIQLKSQ